MTPEDVQAHAYFLSHPRLIARGDNASVTPPKLADVSPQKQMNVLRHDVAVGVSIGCDSKGQNPPLLHQKLELSFAKFFVLSSKSLPANHQILHQ